MITRKMIEAKLAFVAEELGHAGEPWIRQADGRLKATVGVWYLEYNMYYGYAIQEMYNAGGGTTCIKGGCSAREMYAYLCGMAEAIDQPRKRARAAELEAQSAGPR
jgi:hypothetical protein